MFTPVIRFNWSLLLLPLVLLAFLAGCSGKDIDPDDLPKDLVDFKPTLKIKKVWGRGIGGGRDAS